MLFRILHSERSRASLEKGDRTYFLCLCTLCHSAVRSNNRNRGYCAIASHPY
ncbi:hypothetical protein [Microcoleus sp. FACHB-831]|uniref:hypothetical protein n=1 Tax=Microcoleus sp. FACHB-831 TaxID=2692827 RepID=UPI00168935BF|nr:hypothetical protein [Microcoleus sp. FACHB-831]